MNFATRAGVRLGSSTSLSASSSLLWSLELSGTQVYEAKTRALLGSASHFCEIVPACLSLVVRLLSASADRGVNKLERFDALLPESQVDCLTCAEFARQRQREFWGLGFRFSKYQGGAD